MLQFPHGRRQFRLEIRIFFSALYLAGTGPASVSPEEHRPHGSSRRRWNVETYWWNLLSRCMMDYLRIHITEWNLAKIPDSMECQSWKINFRTEVCLRTADPQITLHWIKERQIVGRTDFPDFDLLDALIASALKKLLNTQSKFPEKSKCRRAASSEFRPILARKTNCVHDFRVFPCNRSL